MKMTNETLFIIASFIVVVICIVVLKDPLTCVLVLSLIINLALIANNGYGDAISSLDFTKPKDGTTHAPSTTPAVAMQAKPTTHAYPDDENRLQSPDVYGPYYERWHAYNDTHNSAYDIPQMHVGISGADRNYNIDAANTIMAQRRARDRKCTDGWASKDANYYKYHFAGELDQEEKKRWWGNSEW